MPQGSLASRWVGASGSGMCSSVILMVSAPPLQRRKKQVPLENWFTYGGERSGRFEGMKNKDGSVKTECGIHSK